MKEIETLVEEKTKESLDVSRLTREGEPAEGGRPAVRAARQASHSPGGSTHQRFAQPITYQLLLGLPPHPTHQELPSRQP